jgi:acetyl-CoA carboxylase carboxyl transferase subunit beta
MMNWLKRARRGIRTLGTRGVPEGLWKKCPSCGEILYTETLENRMSVCRNCSMHFRISPDKYLDILFDMGSFTEIDSHLVSIDPLEFKDSKKYTKRISSARKKTGRNSAVITGTANIKGRRVALAIMDFSFLGGSMGSVVGEKIARIARKAVSDGLPLIVVSASGGARMQESILSLMQMAKTSASIALVSEAGLPFISILTHPTTGGVAASFAFQGDVIIAEPKALIGFAGPRVIRETVGEELPEGFQRSEFLLEHGMIDMICSREEMKNGVAFIIESFMQSRNRMQKEENPENDGKMLSVIW